MAAGTRSGRCSFYADLNREEEEEEEVRGQLGMTKHQCLPFKLLSPPLQLK